MNIFLNTPFNGITIEFGSFVPYRTENPFHKDRKNHGFVMNLTGKKRYIFQTGEVLEVGEYDIFYLPKSSNYKVESILSSGCYAINFVTTDELSIKPFVYSPKNRDKFLKAFKTVAKYRENKTLGYIEKTNSVLYEIIYELKKEITSEYMPKSTEALILPATEYIKDNYTNENISIAYLASICGISEPYLRKIFRNTFGTSPLEYIRKLKLSRAKELISSGEFSISEAAEMSGFFDTSYFSREFKKEYGMSPKYYNRQNH